MKPFEFLVVVLLSVLILAGIVALVNAVTGPCERAGGVYHRGVCLNKNAVIELP